VAEAFAARRLHLRAPGHRDGERGRSAGLRLQRADRALRPRAAGRDRRAQRRSCPSPSAPPRWSPSASTAGVAAPVMVMRGDGGATDLDGFRRAPARTLYSGPAASVAGALRFAVWPRASWSRWAARRPTSPPSSAGGPCCPTSRWPATRPPCGPWTCG
jgi:hypothetical protein